MESNDSVSGWSSDRSNLIMVPARVSTPMRECFFVPSVANRPPALERGIEGANNTFFILEVRYDGEEDY
ncbi:MAG TPA: hypothetical protein GXX21_05070 [Syntrophomonadaceae bacterium]|nr:hypothetical protein [Syntrophomonadaceae bacterium]HHW28908.1 hypothetical protein [Syntrophomonadaceae bacterium]